MLKRKANMEQFNNLYTELYKNAMRIIQECYEHTYVQK